MVEHAIMFDYLKVTYCDEKLTDKMATKVPTLHAQAQ